jgi:hypothetical protein
MTVARSPSGVVVGNVALNISSGVLTVYQQGSGAVSVSGPAARGSWCAPPSAQAGQQRRHRPLCGVEAIQVNISDQPVIVLVHVQQMHHP